MHLKGLENLRAKKIKEWLNSVEKIVSFEIITLFYSFTRWIKDAAISNFITVDCLYHATLDEAVSIMMFSTGMLAAKSSSSGLVSSLVAGLQLNFTFEGEHVLFKTRNFGLLPVFCLLWISIDGALNILHFKDMCSFRLGTKLGVDVMHILTKVFRFFANETKSEMQNPL